MTTTPTRRARFLSFGFKHPGQPLPQGTVVFDTRDWFKDPHVTPDLRELTGADYPVIMNVLSTPGVLDSTDRLFQFITTLAATPGGGLVTVAVGCSGGRHRAPVITDVLACRARAHAWDVLVEHRDITKPVIAR